MKKYKNLLNIFLMITIVFTAFHFMLLFTCTETIHVQSLVLVLVPYGFPILMAALALNEGYKDKKLWTKTGMVMAVLFAVSFFAMVTHVTIGFILKNDSYINIYFNVPLGYVVPMMIFAILWGITKRNNKGNVNSHKKTRVEKILDSIPILLLMVMTIHCMIVAIINVVRLMDRPLITSFPWWVTPLLIALAYIVAIGVVLLIRGMYNRAQRRSKK